SYISTTGTTTSSTQKSLLHGIRRWCEIGCPRTPSPLTKLRESNSGHSVKLEPLKRNAERVISRRFNQAARQKKADNISTGGRICLSTRKPSPTDQALLALP